MVDEIKSFKTICAGGLNSNENHLLLSEDFPGSATRLVNFEPSLYGGYRRIEGFGVLGNIDAAVGGSSAEGRILGLAIYQNTQYGLPYIIAARKDVSGNTYSFYKFVDFVGWTAITTGLTLNSVDGLRSVTKIRHITFSIGVKNYCVFVDGVNNAVLFDGLNWDFINPNNSGTASSVGGAMALAAPSLVTFFDKALWLGGDLAFPTQIAFSFPNAPFDFNTVTAGSVAGAGQITPPFNVVQFKPFRAELFVFGSNAIQKAVRTELGYSLDDVTKNVGCQARDSVVEIAGDLLFLAPDGFRPVSATSKIGDIQLETVSKKIQITLTNLIKNYNPDTLNAVVIRSKSQVRFFVGDGTTDTDDSYGILGGLSEIQNSIQWSFGELSGIRASCCTSEYIGNKEFVIHGDYNGKVYQQENGDSFDGANILSVYSTPYLDFGDTEQRKSLRKVNTFLRSEGPVEILLAMTYDWGDNSTLVPSTYKQASTGGPTVYGEELTTYGGTNILYGGNNKPIMVTDLQGSGFSVQATFVAIGQTKPFSIQGLVFEFSVNGRR